MIRDCAGIDEALLEVGEQGGRDKESVQQAACAVVDAGEGACVGMLVPVGVTQPRPPQPLGEAPGKGRGEIVYFALMPPRLLRLRLGLWLGLALRCSWPVLTWLWLTLRHRVVRGLGHLFVRWPVLRHLHVLWLRHRVVRGLKHLRARWPVLRHLHVLWLRHWALLLLWLFRPGGIQAWQAV